MKTQEIGQLGEAIAVKHLRLQQYEILEQNWRSGRKEIDIIAQLDGVLVFIEVKTRSSNLIPPQEAVNRAKQQRIAHAARGYMQLIKHDWRVRFDIIAIVFHDQGYTLRHIEDAFFPGW